MPLGRRARPFIAACVGVAVVHAIWLAWLSDDAFISFRYARNLVEGSGLVYNAGERVEGFTNPLWTLFVAAGIKLGAAPEVWANAWGIAAYGGSIALLGLVHVRARGALGLPATVPFVPLAALGGALHADWAAFATSGLETSAFTFFALASLAALAVRDERVVRRCALAGSLLALAAMTRHDGVLFAAVAFGFAVVRRGLRAALALAVAFAVLWVPFTAWRAWYYGDVLPNTYYAKSAALSYLSQGLYYVAGFFERYWLLAAAFVGVVFAARRVRPAIDVAVLAWGFVLVYVAYVARVGGDFMFARMLVPVTPMLLILLDLSALVLASAAPRLALPVGATCAITLGLFPPPDPAHGIIDERAHLAPARMVRADARARAIEPFLAGLPVVVAIYGDEARLAYYARIPIVIEAHTGLTDRFIAHQVIHQRHEVPGHEKIAPLSYLIEDRRADLTFSRVPTVYQGLDDYIPPVRAQLGEVRARLLHWNPPLVDALRKRGAKIDDFPSELDGLIRQLGSLSTEDVRREYERCRHFYFEHVADPEREAVFVRRLGG